MLGVYEDYVNPELKYPSGFEMKLDVFVPERRIAFEYHGEQHYTDVYNISAQWLFKERDQQKRLICKEFGITLVEVTFSIDAKNSFEKVPYWWDCTKESIISSINSQQGQQNNPNEDLKSLFR
jgi:hypothetical protein